MPHESDNVLDVRTAAEFHLGHRPGAVNIPLDELSDRQHELPPRGAALRVVAPAGAEIGILRDRYEATMASPDAVLDTEVGPSRGRLWRPNDFLVEAVSRIPARGRALDLACGSGRDAVWLALQGFEVEAIDVLPDALARASDLAARSGVKIETIQRDVEAEPTLPLERYDLVSVFHFLWRPLFPAIRAAVRPGGHVVYETFHTRTRETGRRPCNPAHLLETGELERLFEGFEILIARDAVEYDGRYVSSVIARRRA